MTGGRLFFATAYPVSTPLVYGTYPGSSVIALDVAEHLGRKLRAAAWDISADPIASLMNALGAEKHSVRTRPAMPGEEDVTRANFLFIDPPKMELWSTVKAFLDLDVPNVLVWLPLHPSGTPAGNGPPPLSRAAEDARKDASAFGYSATLARWDHKKGAAQALVGCQLIYRFELSDATMALREAVEEVATRPRWTPRWTVKHFD